jgi:hypothetical protein
MEPVAGAEKVGGQKIALGGLVDGLNRVLLELAVPHAIRLWRYFITTAY